MPRRARSSEHLLARVRDWFGLQIIDLALYLNVSPSLLRKIETGQGRLSPTVAEGLLPLLQHLPPPEQQAAAQAQAAAEADFPPLTEVLAVPPLAPGSPAPEAAELAFRRKEARVLAARRLTEAAVLAQRARVASRWAAALPTLLPPDPDTPEGAAHYAALPPDPDDPTRAPDHARWLRGWLRHRARPLTPAEVARYYRLRAQAIGLLAEVASIPEGLISV